MRGNWSAWSERTTPRWLPSTRACVGINSSVCGSIIFRSVLQKFKRSACVLCFLLLTNKKITMNNKTKNTHPCISVAKFRVSSKCEVISARVLQKRVHIPMIRKHVYTINTQLWFRLSPPRPLFQPCRSADTGSNTGLCSIFLSPSCLPALLSSNPAGQAPAASPALFSMFPSILRPLSQPLSDAGTTERGGKRQCRRPTDQGVEYKHAAFGTVPHGRLRWGERRENSVTGSINKIRWGSRHSGRNGGCGVAAA